MNLKLITPPPYEPVTLQQVYDHLRLDPVGSPPAHRDDALLRTFLAAARQQVERVTHTSIVQQTWRQSFSGFGMPWRWPGGVRLLNGPVLRVLSVGYYDQANVLQEALEPDWYLVEPEKLATIRAPEHFVVPEVYGRPDAVIVDFVAGYAPEGSPPQTQADYVKNVPEMLQTAILLGVQMLYDNLKPDERDRMERTWKALVQPFEVPVVS